MKRLSLSHLIIICLVYLTSSNVALAADKASEAKVSGFAGAEYWRVIKDGNEGTSQVKGIEAGVLINVEGEYWRHLRNKWVSPYGAYALLGVLCTLLIFYLIVGQKKLDHPRTNKKIKRWSQLDRANHWTVAILFITLALTGLSLLYGKFFLKGLLGDSTWGNYIALCKILHNYLGSLFMLALLIMIVRWLKHNFFNATDLRWFIKGGGIFGNAHPSAGFLNGGEKVWFWLLTFGGVTISISGLILDFPLFGQTREIMQWSNIIHAVSSLILIAASFGHIYIGTAGTEGALEGMTTGYVDESWAKQHHDLWYEEKKIKSTNELM